MYMVLSGSVTSAGTTRTFGSGQYSYFNARMVTDHRDVTCGVTGSSTYRVIGENAVDTEYATTQRCGSTTFQSNGGLETRLVNSHVLVSGLSRQITTGPAGGSIVVCVYADFDVTTATCADFAAACDLPQSSCD